MAQVLNMLVRATADFESSVTSVERIREYCGSDEHEVSHSAFIFGPSAYLQLDSFLSR